jgi:hypothetical protein
MAAKTSSPGKRGFSPDQQRVDHGFTIPPDRADLESIKLTGPIEVPVTGDPVTVDPADVRPAPKAGPSIQGGGRARGVGRGQGAAPARRYAFRRS